MSEFVKIAYTGPSVDDGCMDIAVLGPALIAFGELITEANRVVNNGETKIQVRVNANFKKGSFEIQLELIQTFLEQIQSLFKNNSNSITQLLGMLGFLGDACGITGINLIHFIKWKHAQKTVTYKPEPNGNVIVVGDNSNVIINSNVLTLSDTKNDTVKLLADVIKPLQLEGVDGFEVRDVTNKSRVLQRVNKTEAQAFVECSRTKETPNNVMVHEYRQIVKILTVKFEEPKWKFESGETKFYAKIEDEEFLAHCENGDIAFAKGDMLTVLLEQIQRVSEQGKIKNEYTIKKVERVNKKGEEPSLFLG